jgi:arylsulfatase
VINITGKERGVIVACGGFTGGYTMFIKNRRVYYDYNFLDGVHYIIKSPPLKKGETKVSFKFTHAGDFAGSGELDKVTFRLLD